MKVLLRIPSLAVGLTLFLCCIGISGQTASKPLEAAEMFDEYGRIGGCDHSARLDNLAIAIQNNPQLEGYLVYYGPESASEPTLSYIKDYLINSRGLREEHWKTIYAGPNSDLSEPRIQLWLAPRGSPPPELVSYESKVETFNGLFVEQRRWDGVSLGEGELLGPPVPDVSVPTFVDMLKKQKGTLGYIVAFSGTESAPGAWRRVAKFESEEFQSKGVTADRLRTIYGGTDQNSKETKIQLWILPANAPPPLVDAGPELPPSRTTQIGTFGEYELGDERGERWAFNVLLDALRTGEELRACIIIRTETETVARELEERGTPLAIDVPAMPDEIPEAQPADFLKLVDKWKNEFTDKYRIRQDRFIVLFTTAREHEGSTLETWIVPPGSLLPDPDSQPEETIDDPKPAEEGTEKTKAKPVEEIKDHDRHSIGQGQGDTAIIPQITGGLFSVFGVLRISSRKTSHSLSDPHLIQQIHLVAPILFNFYK